MPASRLGHSTRRRSPTPMRKRCCSSYRTINATTFRWRIKPAEPIDTQHDIADRREHILWLAEDGKLPPVAIVGLDDPAEPIAAAVARAGLAIDLDAVPVLAWPLSDGVRYRLRHRLPRVPRAGAVDANMPADFVSKTIVGVSDRWP